MEITIGLVNQKKLLACDVCGTIILRDKARGWSRRDDKHRCTACTFEVERARRRPQGTAQVSKTGDTTP